MILGLHGAGAQPIAKRLHARGNILFLLLIGIVVFAALTAVVMQSSGGISNLTRERSQIAVDRTFSFASNLKAAVGGLIQSRNISETALRFAHPSLVGYGTIPDPRNAVFGIEGGGVDMVDVPQNVTTVVGQQWEFYGFSRAQNVGDDATPDLMLVLPNVTEAFCQALNAKIGFADNAVPPVDDGVCVNDTTKRFTGTFTFEPNATANPIGGTFPSTPAQTACVRCADNSYNFYYVLLER